MKPFYFGSSEAPLLGVYHPPARPAAHERAVVLCAPFGHEYMRGHRALRRLAELLAERGLHAFRFDYFATGDSSGEGEEGSIEHWIDDVAAAVEELEDNAGLETVSLVGLRLGAALAAQAAAQRDDIEELVLWDPVVRGADYLGELLERATPSGSESNGASDVLGVHGFPLTGRMRSGIQQIDLLALAAPPTRAVSIFASSERESVARLHAHLTAQGVDAAIQCVESDGSWGELDAMGSLLLPIQMVEAIAARLAPGEER